MTARRRDRTAARGSLPSRAAMVRDYEVNGFAGPFQLFTRSDMARRRAVLERTVLADGGGLEMRLVDSVVVREICSHRKLLDAMTAILGPDLVIWRSRFIVKKPGGAEIPWHHDGAYYRACLDPLINVSAWIAIDDVDRDNACVRVIPGSHKMSVNHLRADAGVDPAFTQMAELETDLREQAVYLEMPAGHCFIFNESLLHGSPRNSSDRRRIGLTVRFTVPSVNILESGRGAVLIKGVDRNGHNQYLSMANRCDGSERGVSGTSVPRRQA
jgi:ectoine hydroxylase-related dioxygenase (phytanoyl-CoA dioxygenase family)